MKFLSLIVLTLSTSIASGGGLLQLKILNVPNLILQSEEASSSSSNVFLIMNEPIDPVLLRIESTHFPDRSSRATELRNQLLHLTTRSQARLLAVCSLFGVETVGYWITNRIYVRGASLAFLTVLEGLLAAGLFKEMRVEQVYPPLPVVTSSSSSATSTGTAPSGDSSSPPLGQWNLEKIGILDAWNRTQGAGMVVGIIDGGVRVSHETLVDNYVGNGYPGWLDPIGKTTSPNDQNGHGTHCAGIVCGKNGIGVAPQAKWMACKGCSNNGCPESALLSCGQFMTCPSSAGSGGNCSAPPNVVSNSWGGSNNNGWYDNVISSWNAAKICPVFAIGNSGPKCGTAISPGDRNGVIAVGSTNNTDTVSTYSSRGPRMARDGVITPQISAPGEKTNSSYYLADDSYKVLSGTSMATPHVAGAIALILSTTNSSSLSRDELLTLLCEFQNVFRPLRASGANCGANDQGTYPNDVAGCGRLNVTFVKNLP